MKTELSRGNYFLIWGALMFLLLLTWIAAEINLGPFNVIVALLIALAKMSLVILYFMHVRYSSKLTRVFVVAGFLWLCILIVLGMSDYLSRGWMS